MYRLGQHARGQGLHGRLCAIHLQCGGGRNPFTTWAPWDMRLYGLCNLQWRKQCYYPVGCDRLSFRLRPGSVGGSVTCTGRIRDVHCPCTGISSPCCAAAISAVSLQQLKAICAYRKLVNPTPMAWPSGTFSTANA